MTAASLFIDDAGRLRSGWRFVVFAVLLGVVTILFGVVVAVVRELLPAAAREGIAALLAGGFGFIAQGALLLVVATLLGWLCGRLLEGLPPRALGWAFHRGWARDLCLGSLVGAGSLLLAAGLIALAGGYRFEFNAGAGAGAIARTLVTSFVILMLGAAGEEVLFRGYPLQTMLRSNSTVVAVVVTSALFAAVHLDNPNAVPGWTFANTTLAGVWLAIAYARTGSLWFPLGIHWAWNWTMTALLGIPVSGITEIAPAPVLRATEQGADWFTGGAYGVEGGAACTLALLLSSLFLIRTRLVSITPEMRSFVGSETDAARTSDDAHAAA